MDSLRNKKIITVLLYISAFACMFAGLFVYGKNDDTGMRSMAMGAYSGKPDSHLQWLPYVSGFVLSHLYTAVPEVDWYGFFLLVFPISSIIYVFISCIYGKKINTETVIFGYLSILCFAELLNFQWTTSAAICGASAIMIYSWSEGYRNRAASSAYLLLCYFIRQYTFYCICLGLLWTFFYKCIRRYDDSNQKTFEKGGNNNKNAWIKFINTNIIWVIPVLIVLFFSTIIDHLNYRSEEWVTYREYCNSRAIVYDYTGVPTWDNNELFWKANGFEEDTVDMLRMYQIGFLDEVGKDELDIISTHVKENRNTSFDFKQSVVSVIIRLLHSSYIYILVPFFLCVVILICIKVYKKKYIDVLYIFLNVLFWGMVATYFIIGGKYPDRTEFIVILCMSLNILQTVNNDEYVEEKSNLIRFFKGNLFVRKSTINSCIAILIITTIFLPLSKLVYEKYEIRTAQYNRNLIGIEIDDYFYNNSENYYVMCDANEIVVTKNFRIINNSITPSNTVETLGWGIRNPLWVDKLSLMGGTSINEVIFNEDVYLCAYDEERALKIKSYLDKNVAVCDIVETDLTDYGMHVYKLSKKRGI